MMIEKKLDKKMEDNQSKQRIYKGKHAKQQNHGCAMRLVPCSFT